jgi:hypothetical protein
VQPREQTRGGFANLDPAVLIDALLAREELILVEPRATATALHDATFP